MQLFSSLAAIFYVAHEISCASSRPFTAAVSLSSWSPAAVLQLFSLQPFPQLLSTLRYFICSFLPRDPSPQLFCFLPGHRKPFCSFFLLWQLFSMLYMIFRCFLAILHRSCFAFFMVTGSRFADFFFAASSAAVLHVAIFPLQPSFFLGPMALRLRQPSCVHFLVYRAFCLQAHMSSSQASCLGLFLVIVFGCPQDSKSSTPSPKAAPASVDKSAISSVSSTPSPAAVPTVEKAAISSGVPGRFTSLPEKAARPDAELPQEALVNLALRRNHLLQMLLCCIFVEWCSLNI